MVYKHAISTIVPSRVVRLPTSGNDTQEGMAEELGNGGGQNY
jgi:hypothetical protein